MNAGLALLLILGALLIGGAVGFLVASARGAADVERARLDAARATTLLEAERAGTAERFEALAAQALAVNSEQFLVLADQRLAASTQTHATELARREEAVRGLVAPLTRTLDEVRAQVSEAERQRATGTAALNEQVRAMRETSEGLRSETGRLVTALRASQVRGRWGEVQLRRVVEAAGMLNRVDFVEQPTVATDDGLLRPDMVVHLAGGKKVVVDAKVAFLGYLEAVEAEDAAVRAERLAAHARHVRTHVDQLASKEYWKQFTPSPELVVMFVPAESFLSAALEADPTLLEHAFDRDVVLATPTTLLALLRTVAYAWRQDALASNAQQVLDLGKELHGRLATMGEHLARLGRSLDGAAQAYNKTIGSLETRVLVTARRFADLDVVTTPLDAPPAVDPRLSTVSAPELIASASEQVVALPEREAGNA